MRRGLAAVAMMLGCCAALQGCGTTPVGQGPITFGPKAQANYDEYRRRVGPGAFVVGERGTYYSYCEQTTCAPGEISLATQLCRRNGDTDCRLYDVGGRVVWRRDLPAAATGAGTGTVAGAGTGISAEVRTERARNAAKVDCSRALKPRLSPAFDAELATTLAVKPSRVPWTFCDRLVEAVASGQVPERELTALASEPLDEAAIRRLAQQLRPAGGEAV